MNARLIVTCGETTSEFPLDPLGTTIGRDPDCDIFLDSGHVSRLHARLFLDPFERWILEDLGSTNGTLVNGEPVDVHALLPGEVVTLEPFSATLVVQLDVDEVLVFSGSGSTQVHDAKVEILRTSAGGGQGLLVARLKDLNRFTDRLSALSDAADIYPTACRLLGGAKRTMALVLRLSVDDDALDTQPLVLAHHVTGSDGLEANVDVANLRLSRRVLDAVRTDHETVMAKSLPPVGEEMSLTIRDELKPRAVLCTRIGQQPQCFDVIYLDMPLKQVSDETMDFLQAATHQVRLTRESLLLAEMRTKRRVLDRELAMAEEIQSKLTPEGVPDVAGVDVAVLYRPAMWVGGDYCDIWSLPNGRMALALGDVSGKGLPAALVMANLHAVLRTAAEFCGDPGEIMSRVNRHLLQHLPEGMFVTLFFGLLTPGDGILQYVNAGHILPLLIDAKSGASPLGRPSNPVLGVVDRSFAAETQELTHGTTLLAVTDGVTETRAPDDEEFSFERLGRLADEWTERSAEEIVQAVADAATDFRKDRPQHDDTTILAMARKLDGA